MPTDFRALRVRQHGFAAEAQPQRECATGQFRFLHALPSPAKNGRRRGAGILFFILLALLTSLHAQNPDNFRRAQEFYEKALQNKNAKDRIQLLQKAAQLFPAETSQLLNLPPRWRPLPANIYARLGREFYQQAKWPLAVSYFEKSAALEPGNVEFRRALAQSQNALTLQHISQGKIEAAHQAIFAAVRSDSTFLPARVTLGLVYFQQRKYDAAVSAYHRVLPRQPSAQLYNNLGAAYEAKGDFAAAVKAYLHALELEARLAAAQKNLLRAREKLGKTKTAATAERKKAAADSARLAARAADSLLALIKKPVTKDKPAKDKKSDLAAQKSKTPVDKNIAVAPKTSKEQVARHAKSAPPQRESSANNAVKTKTSPAVSSANLAKKDSLSSLKVLPQSSSSLSAIGSVVAPSPSFANTNTSPVVRTPRVSKSSLWPYVYALGAVLFGVFVFTQRRRLNRVWLQLKTAPAISAVAILDAKRLLMAGTNGVHKNQEKLLPSAVAAAAPEIEAEAFEPRQPSLQTQAFFAEMIAAEPDIDEFDATKEKLLEEILASEVEARPPTGMIIEEEAVKLNGDEETSGNTPLTGENVAQTSPPEDKIFALHPVTEALQSSVSTGLPAFSEDQAEQNGHAKILTEPSPASLEDDFAASNVVQNHLENDDAQAPPGETEPVRASTSKEFPASAASRGRDSTSQKLDLTDANKRQATNGPDSFIKNIEGKSGQTADAAKPFIKTLGRYQIEGEIGKGAMGNIYLALDPKLDRRVVIKTVCFNLATSEVDTATLKDRVYREARAIAKLGHPNIVVVYDVEDDKELSYIVMEHIEGRDLRQTLKSERRFDYMRAAKIMAQVCSALECAHQAGIIHRDIKPSNIMLLPDDKAKVTDFGIAKITDNFALTLPGHVLGTPSYMAPEQFEGHELDGRADIFSLGVVFYELITGNRPFSGETLAALAYKIVHKMHIPPSLQNVELPLDLDDVIGRALAKQPEERYQSATEFRDALLAMKPLE